MSAGKLVAQCSHASIAFLSHIIQAGDIMKVTEDEGEEKYDINIEISTAVVDEWISDIFTKTICEAKNRNQLMKAVAIAEEMGLKENKDFFLLKDCCLTELDPEETDENGIRRTLTCIGFRPLPEEMAHKISKKFQLYK